MTSTTQSSSDVQHDPNITEQSPDGSVAAPEEFKIAGYDRGTPPMFKEPSLFLAVSVIFIATFFSFGKNPAIFLPSFALITALAITFHALAERMVFKSKKEFDRFSVPFDGVFVVTFGAVLPGLVLFAYGLFAMFSSDHTSWANEIGKLGLLVAVPIFNFLVWSQTRRGYLVRPRLTGLMNGLAVGLSASWTGILVWSTFIAHNSLTCKFGWMLLMCAAPFLFVSAACLYYDLLRKTEENICRITSTFTVLGAALSVLFIVTPAARVFMCESLISAARCSIGDRQSQAIATLRDLTTDDDLHPSNKNVSGFALAQLLFPERGFRENSDRDSNLYFRITGKPLSGFNSLTGDDSGTSSDPPNPAFANKTYGLSLAKSQITGLIDAPTLSGAIDWTFTFRNSSSGSAEAGGEIALPKGAVVSRATLWIDGQPRDAIVKGPQKAQQTYNSLPQPNGEQLVVNMSGPDRVQFLCSPIETGSDTKIRLSLKLPLASSDGVHCTMNLPRLVSANFTPPKRHRISIDSHELPQASIPGLEIKTTASGYQLCGIVRNNDPTKSIGSIAIQRSTAMRVFTVPDWSSVNGRYMVEQIRELTTFAPKHLFVVIDSSSALKLHALEIKQTLAALSSQLPTSVYFVPQNAASSAASSEIKALTFENIAALLSPQAFVGGQDNSEVLTEALETAAAKANCAVLWIHGPQPSVQNSSEFRTLELMQNVCLYDLALEPGPATVLQGLKGGEGADKLSVVTLNHHSTFDDVQKLVADWTKGAKQLTIVRTISSKRPDNTVISDQAVSAQITALWARDEVARLLANGQKTMAAELASKYRIVTPVSGMVVSEIRRDYDVAPAYAASGGLVGAPVDPRYGQSNEVGQMADFGYDTARDISRIATVLSLLVSIVMATCFLRSRKSVNMPVLVKAGTLVVGVPIVVHLMGTFVINNFGGLGGGL